MKKSLNKILRSFQKPVESISNYYILSTAFLGLTSVVISFSLIMLLEMVFNRLINNRTPLLDTRTILSQYIWLWNEQDCLYADTSMQQARLHPFPVWVEVWLAHKEIPFPLLPLVHCSNRLSIPELEHNFPSDLLQNENYETDHGHIVSFST